MSDTQNKGAHFGTLLQEARLKKSLSLEEVSADIKISIKLLRYIEESNLDELPQRAFTRGLIKSYSQYLGVSPGEALYLYNSNFESNSDLVQTGVLKNSDDTKAVFISDVFQKTILPITVLILTVGGVFLISKFLDGYKPASHFSDSRTFSDQAPSDSTAPSQNETLPAKTTMTAENESPSPSAAAETLNTLTVEPLDKTYLTIKTNLDEQPVRASLKPNKTRTFKFESAEIKFYDAGAVNLLFNGKDIGVPGNFGEQKVVKFPPQNVE